VHSTVEAYKALSSLTSVIIERNMKNRREDLVYEWYIITGTKLRGHCCELRIFCSEICWTKMMLVLISRSSLVNFLCLFDGEQKHSFAL
jgi:hypothetical protein